MQTSLSSLGSSAPPPLTFEMELQLLLEKYEKDKETNLEADVLQQMLCDFIDGLHTTGPQKPYSHA
jgi:hypothetical protein